MFIYYWNVITEKILIYIGYFFRNQLRGGKQEKPIFIVSAGRSGSTLLRKLLIQTGLFNIPPESGDLIPSLTKEYLKYITSSWEVKTEKIIKLIKTTPDLEIWNINIHEFGDSVKKISSPNQNLAEIIRLLYNSYAKQNGIPETQYWGDKTPYLVNRIPWIQLLFPRAIIIHVIRDPRAVVLSRMKAFNESPEWAIKRWRWAIKSVSKARRKNNIKDIKFEELLTKTEETLKDILISLSPELKYEKKYKSVYLGDDHYSHHQNLDKPLQKEKINEWEQLITKEDRKLIEKTLSVEMKKYGYLK